MGAPLIELEKLASGVETKAAFKVVESLLAANLISDTNRKLESAWYVHLSKIAIPKKCNENNEFIVDAKQIEQLAIKEEDGIKVVYNADGVQAAIDQSDNSNKVVALLCAEIGGANSMEPLVVGNFTSTFIKTHT